MDLYKIAVLAVVLGIDAMSVAMAMGACGCTFKQECRLSFFFGLFQFTMPIIGWFLGKSIITLVQRFDHWIAFGLLFIIGIKMLYGAFKRGDGENIKCDRTTGWHIIALSIATSIDALGAGMGLGILNTPILYPSSVIGITTAVMTFAGARLGGIFLSVAGKRMEAIGGIVLIALSIKMLLTI